MLLAIDVGNTNSVIALFEGDEPVAQWRASTSTTRTADEYAVWLSQLMEFHGQKLTDISECIISTVVPQSLFHLRNLSRRYFNCEPFVIGHHNIPGVEVRINKPSEAGADRLVNAVGAFTAHGGPLVVVDSGTATNFDIVGSDGAFEGGVIAPGINLSMQALHEAAARLPRIAIERPDKVIGTDTVGAMQTGVFWGYVSLIDGLIERIKKEYAKPIKVVATGGIASLFEGQTEAIDIFDHDLTIRGLLEISKRLKAK
ncbi:type III pantothenate kinase [Hyphococcus flavus]|uniref:Type III pantothenate kinase n=1 Tax=Hyphococcus flavus TaxID=1866326 RepID=A0AAE9ZBR3_9PROT|nr:type III pantothenate kinase [Hyphococcus flavus]WDI31793.1 type III pantothenate kinase [Hyphococcus flavus]